MNYLDTNLLYRNITIWELQNQKYLLKNRTGLLYN